MPSARFQDLYCRHCQRIFSLPSLPAGTPARHAWTIACPTCDRKAEVQVHDDGKVVAPLPLDAQTNPAAGQFLPYPFPFFRDVLLISSYAFGLLVTGLLGFAAWAMHVQPWLCPLAFCALNLLFLLYIVFLLAITGVLGERTVGNVLGKIGQYLSYSFRKRPPRGSLDP